MNRNDLVINFGGAVKAAKDEEFDLEGDLMVFTEPGETDLDGERFDATTNIKRKDGDRIPIYGGHGFDPFFGNTELGYFVISKAEKSVRVKGKIEIERGAELDDYLATTTEGKAAKSAGADAWNSYLDKEYEAYKKIILQRAKEGTMKLSSGAHEQMIRKSGDLYTVWPLIEGSLVVNPAEPKTSVTPIKSFVEAQPVKSIYSHAMARDAEPYLWNACSNLESGFYQLNNLQYNAEGTDIEINALEKFEEMLTEFVADARSIAARYFGKNSKKNIKNLTAELRVSMPVELQIKAARDAELDSTKRLVGLGELKETEGKKAKFLETYGATIDEIIVAKKTALAQLEELRTEDSSAGDADMAAEELEVQIEFEKLKFAKLKGN